jgi:pyruvate,water dikinase
MSNPPHSSIVWFREIGGNDVMRVGGKGASLGELTRAGIRVPAGFVVTTQAFEQFMGVIDRDGTIRRAISTLAAQDLDTIRPLSEEIRSRFGLTPLPGELYAGIASAYRQLCGNHADVPVAVRSSATSEDSAEASFAGLQDTYLWVRGEESVVNWIRCCWASLYNPESISYRLRLNLREDQLAMGVVVQEMVNAYCSGVMFSRSPTSGDRSVVTLEGSWGLGSSVVSGEVTPDKYVVNKVTTAIVSRVIASKMMQHLPDPGGSGVIAQAVPVQQQIMPCLSDEQICALVRIAKEIERHYGCAQDMEWAIARDGRSDGDIYLLQSRPETVWSNREVERIATPKKKAFEHVFSLLSGKQD